MSSDLKKTKKTDLLEVIDNALTAALREVRRSRARGPVPPASAEKGRSKTSNVNRCFDVLVNANRPLHVTVLLEALAEQGVTTSRDTLTSALIKRLAPKGPFVRTAPNTFGLARWEED
jgi:hypothetical protein